MPTRLCQDPLQKTSAFFSRYQPLRSAQLLAECFAHTIPLILIISYEVGTTITSSLHRGLEREFVQTQPAHVGKSGSHRGLPASKAGCILTHPPLLSPPPSLAANLQSPYAQVPCIPLCPKLDKKMVGRKQGGQYMLDQCTSTNPSPDIHSLYFQSGSQGSRWVPKGQGSQPRPIPLLLTPRIPPSKKRCLGDCCSGEEKREEGGWGGGTNLC